MAKKRVNLWPAFFIGPHLILFAIFFMLPAIIGIYISFTEWDLYSTPIFVGFDNFQTILFQKDSIYHTQFMNGFKNTLFFVLLSVPFSVIVPLLLATALVNKPKFAVVFQSILYLPTLFAISAVMIIWGFLLSKSFGPIKEVFGLDVVITGTQPWAWMALVVVTVWWGMGGNLIIYMAALSNVNKELLEAANLDGANAVGRFFHVSLPSIRFPLIFTIIMTTIAQFNIYGQPLMLTGGGPNNSTRVLMMYIQENTFGNSHSVAGISSAMAVLLGLVIILIAMMELFFMRQRISKGSK